ncbi:hypothetical protein HZS_1085 [Henneguya salminicola]|nr:hypothetical protein HZS_1085 [Henneguya salminicola]
MKGTSSEQDSRFSNKDKKLMKTMKFDQILNTPVNMQNVILDTMKTWIAARISQFLGFEDELVIDYVYEMLENEKFPNPQKMQIHLTGFLEAKNARTFMRELWYFLQSAEQNDGIPKEFIELRMAELAAKEKQEKLEKITADSIIVKKEDITEKRYDLINC